MEHDIRGTVMQTVDIRLQPGETIFTESGGMAWMTGNIKMESGMKGGLLKALGRGLAGESMFMVDYTCESGEGLVTFACEFPGKVIPFTLGPGESIICQKDAFMCAEKSVTLEMHFRKKLGAGLFGGEGFILQKLTGPGVAFLEFDGEITDYELGPDHQLKVDTGHLAAFEPTVNFDIAMVKGVKNILFGGEGLFLADVRGPGKVWLQSMPIANLAAKVAQYVPSKGD
ncbi:MAG: TIGR00266 family protein [Armatimonadota bacterium]